MAVHKGFDDISITNGDLCEKFKLSHLENLSISISGFQFEDSRVDDICVYVRPTNHVYSRGLEHSDNEAQLQVTGELLLKYAHSPDNPQAILKNTGDRIKIDSDKRVFCRDRYESSKLLPEFIHYVSRKPNHINVLANSGDVRTCLSALIEFGFLGEESKFYLVFFTLHKKSKNMINMVIETAYVADKNAVKGRLLTSNKYKDRRKPFIVLLKNVFAGRLPFESKKKNKSKRRYKKKAK